MNTLSGARTNPIHPCMFSPPRGSGTGSVRPPESTQAVSEAGFLCARNRDDNRDTGGVRSGARTRKSLPHKVPRQGLEPRTY